MSNLKCPLALCVAILTARTMLGSPHDVQIRTVDIEEDRIEFFNFGNDDVSLDGWRLRLYPSPGFGV